MSRKPLPDLTTASALRAVAPALMLAAGMSAGLAGPSAAETIMVTGSGCAISVRHEPGPDVLYRPGVDVAGAAVVPADLAGGVAVPALEGTVGFDILVNPFEEAGLPARRFGPTEMAVGFASVDLKTGETYLNGQSLSADPCLARQDLGANPLQ